ncbi:hypothetical protein [Thiocapsa roseopersicina]|nr:hypothetical protein [Thiocapsa roseopersicina]
MRRNGRKRVHHRKRIERLGERSALTEVDSAVGTAALGRGA